MYIYIYTYTYIYTCVYVFNPSAAVVGGHISNIDIQIPNIDSQTLTVKHKTLEFIDILLCKRFHKLFILLMSIEFLKQVKLERNSIQRWSGNDVLGRLKSMDLLYVTVFSDSQPRPYKLPNVYSMRTGVLTSGSTHHQPTAIFKSMHTGGSVPLRDFSGRRCHLGCPLRVIEFFVIFGSLVIVESF